MKIWETDGLIKALAAGTMSEKRKLGYFLIGILIGSASLIWFRAFGPEAATWKTKSIHTLVSLSITLLGVLAAFKANRDGIAFIERYICLSVPINIRLMVMIVPVFSAIGFLSGMLGHSDGLNRFLKSNLYDTGFSLFYDTAFYVYMTILFRKMSSIRDSASVSTLSE